MTYSVAMGALSGLLLAFVIFAVTYMQAMEDFETFGRSLASIHPNWPGMLLTLVVLTGGGAAVGAIYHG